MNLSPLSFRIKKYPKDRSKQQRLSRRIKSQKKGLKWTTLETWIKTSSVNVQHCPSFSVQKNSDTEHRARSPKLLDTRLYLHNRRACYNGNWPVRCITPPAYLDPRLYTSRIHGERERNFSHSRARE